MGKLGEAVVEIRPDLKPLDAGLGQAEAKVSRFAGSAKGVLAAGLAAGASVAALGGAAHALVDAAKKAADLGETVSKVRVVFGKAAGLIEGTAQGLADRFGLVKQTTLDAAANIGLVGQAAGLSQQKSAALGSQFVKLAADASSFYNVPMDVALEKIRSALVGESEPIRSFGVLLNEAAVGQEALRLGLAKSTNGLSEQAKVMARASLIVKGMSKATGDLERTQDSTANKLRKFTGDLENLKADFGKGLAGPLTDAIKLANEFGAALAKATNLKGSSGGEVAGDFLGGYINGLRLILKAGDDAANRAKAKGQGAASQVFSWVSKAGESAFFPDQSQADELAGVKKGGKVDAKGTAWSTNPDELKQQMREHRAAADRKRAVKQAAHDAEVDRLAHAFKMERMRIAGNPDFLREKFKGDKAFALGGLAGGAFRTLGRSLDAGASFSAAGKQARDKEYAEQEAERKRQSSLSRAASITGLLEAKGLAQTSALEKDPAVEQQKKTNDKLDDVKALLGTFLSRVGAAAGAGAILKGRS